MDEPWNEESYLAMKTILSIYVKLWVAILIGDISAWEQEWSVVINNFYKAVFMHIGYSVREKDNSSWQDHIHTRKLELDNNVTLVQHIGEDLHFQVLRDPSSEDEEAGCAHGLCCSCTEERISDISTDQEATLHSPGSR
jgi:hypothetical protein